MQRPISLRTLVKDGKIDGLFLIGKNLKVPLESGLNLRVLLVDLLV